MKITNFQGNQTNASNGVVRECSISDLSNLFSKPRKGAKHIGYFIRGELEPAERKDINLQSADLLVIDGDRTSNNEESCCPPIDVHIALSEMEINHFIYTTHSHSFSKNKFRAVIPCTIDNKENLRSTVSKLLTELKDKDCDIFNVKEMNTWSQPWFIPSRDDPDDGLFEHYEYLEGNDYEQVKSETELSCDSSEGNNNAISSSNTNSSVVSNPESVSDIIGCIIRGAPGLHDAINKYAYMQIKDGIAPRMVAETLRGLMMANPVQNERWQDRYEEIDRSVAGAVEKTAIAEKVDLDDLDGKSSIVMSKIPWPPGLMGQLAEDAYAMQLYQYKELAVVSAIGVIAGVAGRKFNVSRTGLNVYLTLIMDTGMGKDSISKFITNALFQAMNDGDGNLITPSFLGKSKYTGAKAIVNSLKNALSQVSIFTEAGLLMQTQSGDQSGLLRALLDIYTKSGNSDIFIGAEYSDADKSVPSLRSPALSIINESTAESLQQAFRDNNSIDSGHLPRQSIYRVVGDKPYLNPHPEDRISDDCMIKLQELISTCAKVQSSASAQAWDFALGSGIMSESIKLNKKYVDEYNKYRGANNNKANMASRMHLKALKFAALASVFNHKRLFIEKPEWDWAVEMVRYEYEGVDNFFMSAGNGEMGDIVTHIVGPVIIKMLQGKYKSSKTSLSTRDRKAGIFPMYTLSFNLKNNSALKKLNDDASFRTNPKTGIQKVLDHMLAHEFIIRCDDPFGTRKTLYRVTEQFKLLMSD